MDMIMHKKQIVTEELKRNIGSAEEIEKYGNPWKDLMKEKQGIEVDDYISFLLYKDNELAKIFDKTDRLPFGDEIRYKITDRIIEEFYGKYDDEDDVEEMLALEMEKDYNIFGGLITYSEILEYKKLFKDKMKSFIISFLDEFIKSDRSMSLISKKFKYLGILAEIKDMKEKSLSKNFNLNYYVVAYAEKIFNDELFHIRRLLKEQSSSEGRYSINPTNSTIETNISTDEVLPDNKTSNINIPDRDFFKLYFDENYYEKGFFKYDYYKKDNSKLLFNTIHTIVKEPEYNSLERLTAKGLMRRFKAYFKLDPCLVTIEKNYHNAIEEKSDYKIFKDGLSTIEKNNIKKMLDFCISQRIIIT
jgi:hypothetical protein